MHCSPAREQDSMAHIPIHLSHLRALSPQRYGGELVEFCKISPRTNGAKMKAFALTIDCCEFEDMPEGAPFRLPDCLPTSGP
eukprot:scaffold203146_cov35-Tisochrysis_lutea.AAC.4